MTRGGAAIDGSDRAQAGADAAAAGLGAILLDGLQALADAGDVDRACRLAGRACAVLRGKEDDRLWRRFNILLHRLGPRAGPVGRPGATEHGRSAPVER